MADYVTRGGQVMLVKDGAETPLSPDDFKNLAQWYADELKGAKEHGKPVPLETAESFALLGLAEVMAYWPDLQAIFGDMQRPSVPAFTCYCGGVMDSASFIIPRHMCPDLARHLTLSFLSDLEGRNYGNALTHIIMATDLHAAMRLALGKVRAL